MCFFLLSGRPPLSLRGVGDGREAGENRARVLPIFPRHIHHADSQQARRARTMPRTEAAGCARSLCVMVVVDRYINHTHTHISITRRTYITSHQNHHPTTSGARKKAPPKHRHNNNNSGCHHADSSAAAAVVINRYAVSP